MKAKEAPEKYPMQFRDKIDEYLWKEHHILGGCCSSTESMKYAVAREVAEKLTDDFIEKACEWLKEHINDYTVMSVYDEVTEIKPKVVSDFKKAMKL